MNILNNRMYGWFILALLVSACAPQGTAQINGTLQTNACPSIQQRTSWSLRSSYITFLYVGNQQQPAVAELRIQAYPGSPTHPNPATQDLLLIEIYNPLQVRVNESIPIVKYEPRLSAQSANNDTNKPSARATLDLGKTCPLQSQPFLLDGSLTFTQFGWKRGDTLAGTLSLDLSPARSSYTNTQGNLQGTFSFPWHPPMELGHDFVGYQPSP